MAAGFLLVGTAFAQTCTVATDCPPTNNRCLLNACVNSQCVQQQRSCDDNNACTADRCDPNIGCINTPIVCDDHNACTADSCDPVRGCVFTPIVCDDKNPCTNDSCDPATGKCIFTPITCDDFNSCTVDYCDVSSGACIHKPTDAMCQPFQVRYAANLGSFSSVDAAINLTNTNASGGNICANVYTFSPDEQEISCCSCLITPNALATLSVKNDLLGNTLTPAIPGSVVVKLIASAPANGTTCNAATAGTNGAVPLVAGLAAWGTTAHATSVGGAPSAITETPFTPATLSASEQSRITGLCSFIQSNGSGYGICKSCRSGALGATAK